MTVKAQIRWRGDFVALVAHGRDWIYFHPRPDTLVAVGAAIPGMDHHLMETMSKAKLELLDRVLRAGASDEPDSFARQCRINLAGGRSRAGEVTLVDAAWQGDEFRVRLRHQRRLDPGVDMELTLSRQQAQHLRHRLEDLQPDHPVWHSPGPRKTQGAKP